MNQLSFDVSCGLSATDKMANDPAKPQIINSLYEQLCDETA